MKDIGHFPMSENYTLFERTLPGRVRWRIMKVNYRQPYRRDCGSGLTGTLIPERSYERQRAFRERDALASREEQQAYVDEMVKKRGYVLDHHKAIAFHEYHDRLVQHDRRAIDR